MNPKSPFILFLFCCLSLNTFLNAQTQIDSLAKYSYEELRKLYRSTENTRLIRIYAKKYLEKAKKDRDSIKIARGYYNISISYEKRDLNLSIKYLDSSINISINNPSSTYPALSLYNKGCHLYNLGSQKKALDILFIALQFIKANKNLSLELYTREAILSIEDNWFADNEKLNFTKSFLIFLSNLKDNEMNYRENVDLMEIYHNVLFNLSLGYIKNEEYENGLKTAIKGIEETINTKDTIIYYEFVSSSGMAQYFLKNYQIAIDSLQKALPYEDNHGKAMGNYYLAKSYDKLNQPEKAHFHFLKTDSIYQATKDVFPEMRDAYEHIIEYYKSKNDVQNQIKYYDRLIAVDKVIDSTYTYVTETVNKKFDTPQAIAERNRLVEEAKAKESSWKYSFAAISAILLVILGVLVAAFRRQKYYKRRFENIMSIEQSRNALNQTKEKETSKKKDIDVPEEIVESILQQLETFEASQKFTKQISLTELAKKLGTNPKYLSKVINGHYQKNFSTYINELRIEYVISKLKEDSKFRNYTIKAIGKEAGFGNTESFSKAFLKTTGINVSYFINQLQKRLES